MQAACALKAPLSSLSRCEDPPGGQELQGSSEIMSLHPGCSLGPQGSFKLQGGLGPTSEIWGTCSGCAQLWGW